MSRQNGNSFNSCTDQVSVQAKFIQEVALWKPFIYSFSYTSTTTQNELNNIQQIHHHSYTYFIVAIIFEHRVTTCELYEGTLSSSKMKLHVCTNITLTCAGHTLTSIIISNMDTLASQEYDNRVPNSIVYSLVSRLRPVFYHFQ